MIGDIHIHSKYSPDSSLDPELIIKTAMKKGLNFISISDHNKFISHRGEILVINGEEVSSADGHILALFIDEEIPPRLSQEETVELIHEKNGIAICAHPFRRVNGIRSRFHDIYDAIEVKNGRCRKGCNQKSKALAEQYKKPMTAGSDAHFYDEIGRVLMEVEAVDEESIRKAIISGGAKVYGDDLTATGQIRLYLKLGKDYALRGFKRI